MSHIKAQAVLGHVDLNGISVREAIYLIYIYIGIDRSIEEHIRRTGKDTEVPYNLRQLVIGLIQKTSLTLQETFNLAKNLRITIAMYQRNGTGKLLPTALISSKFCIIKAIQPYNQSSFSYLVHSSQMHLECVCIYM